LLHRHRYCFAESHRAHAGTSGLPSPYGGAFCRLSSSVGLPSNETVNATDSEVVKLGGLSSEQLLGGNLCALLLYSLISSWQHLWTNTQDNRLQAVKSCVLVWHSSSFMLTCLQIRHSCLTRMHLLQGAHIYSYTVWCARGRSAHILTNAKRLMVRECCLAF
jgi:hypothetical protein